MRTPSRHALLALHGTPLCNTRVYLAILVARLLGLHISEHNQRLEQ